MNGLRVGLLMLAAVALGAAPVAGADGFYDQDDLSLYMDVAAADAMADDGAPGEAAPEGEPAAPAPGKPPPLPLHNLEGTCGGVSSPMAYLSNPGPPGTKIGKPTFSATYLIAGDKEIQSYVVSMTFFRRIEFSYAANRVHLGDFPKAVREVFGVHLSRNHVWQHNLNLRGMVIEETPTIPAVTGGVHFKMNQGVRQIDHRTGGLPRALGFERASGVDFTISCAKTFPKALLGRPVLTNIGLRFTQAAQTGWLGFGNDWATNIEAHVAWVPLDWLAVAYEYKQMKNPYRRGGELVGQENDWHTVLVAWIIDEHMTLAGAWGYLGHVVNHDERGAFGIQFKYEF